MNKIIKNIFTILIGLLLLFIAKEGVKAATYNLTPSSGTFVQTCNSSFNIMIDTQGGETNAADILLLFNPSEIEIIDSDPLQAGKQIKIGNMYQSYFGNIVDEGTGEIRLTGASFSSSFNGTGLFATVQFKSKPGVTSTSFNVYFTGADPYNSLDSNIADTYTSNDLLSGVQNSTYSFITGSCVSDNTPPTITFIAPINGQTGVPANANLSIRISDNATGVDISTVEIVVNGTTYVNGDSGFSFSGSLLSYDFLIDPVDLLYENSTNMVVVRARDLSGNFRQGSITFNTPVTPPPPPPVTDNESPIITFVYPVDRQLIPLESNLTVMVSDSGSGINIDTVRLILNGVAYTNSNMEFSYTGTSSEYTVILDPLENLPESTSTLVVYASDNSGNGVVQSIVFNLIEPIPFVCPVTEINTITIIREDISDIISPVIDPIIESVPEAVIDIASAIVPATSVILSMWLLGLQLVQIPYILLSWFYKLLAFLGLREKGKPYGYVYDSVSKEPVSQAVVRIYDVNGKLVRTDVTDVFGVFTATLGKGKYSIKVSYPNYNFPSKIVIGQTDYPNDRVYHGEVFEVLTDTEPTMSIPIDNTKPDKLKLYWIKTKSVVGIITKILYTILLFVGLTLSFYLLVKYGGLLNAILFILYIPTIYFHFYSTSKKVLKFGTLKDNTGKALNGVTLGLREIEFERIVGKRVTDTNGLYRFIVPGGKYKIELIETGGDKNIVLKEEDSVVEEKSRGNNPIIIARDLTLNV